MQVRAHAYIFSGLYILVLATDLNTHDCLPGPGSNEEEEGLSPMAHVMDDSGAPPAGTLDPGGAKGVVEMPDSEALRRSVAAANAAEHERQLASSNASQPAFEGERGPVPATSSGVHVCLITHSVTDCLMAVNLSQGSSCMSYETSSDCQSTAQALVVGLPLKATEHVSAAVPSASLVT